MWNWNRLVLSLRRRLLRVTKFCYRKGTIRVGKDAVHHCHYFLGGLVFHVGKLYYMTVLPHQAAVMDFFRQQSHLHLTVIKGMGKTSKSFQLEEDGQP